MNTHNKLTNVEKSLLIKKIRPLYFAVYGIIPTKAEIEEKSIWIKCIQLSELKVMTEQAEECVMRVHSLLQRNLELLKDGNNLEEEIKNKLSGVISWQKNVLNLFYDEKLFSLKDAMTDYTQAMMKRREQMSRNLYNNFDDFCKQNDAHHDLPTGASTNMIKRNDRYVFKMPHNTYCEPQQVQYHMMKFLSQVTEQNPFEFTLNSGKILQVTFPKCHKYLLRDGNFIIATEFHGDASDRKNGCSTEQVEMVGVLNKHKIKDLYPENYSVISADNTSIKVSFFDPFFYFEKLNQYGFF